MGMEDLCTPALRALPSKAQASSHAGLTAPEHQNTDTHTHTHKTTHMNEYMHIHMYVYIYIYEYIHLHIDAHTYIHSCIYIYTSIQVHALLFYGGLTNQKASKACVLCLTSLAHSFGRDSFPNT